MTLLDTTKQELIREINQRVEDKILEPNNAELLRKLILNSENINEAISGLMVLGYSKKDIEKAFEHLDIDNLYIEDLIKKGLILLSQK